MAERLNLSVDDGVGDLLSSLAGGERKRGKYLSDLVRGMAQVNGQPSVDGDTLYLALRGLAGQEKALEGRVTLLENTVAALIAKAG